MIVLPQEVIKKLELEDLVQIAEKQISESKFIFLNLGKITLSYDCAKKEIDPFIAKLAGADHNYVLARKCLENSYINVKIPENTTHYYLGNSEHYEELYARSGVPPISQDMIPIVFLKESN